MRTEIIVSENLGFSKSLTFFDRPNCGEKFRIRFFHAIIRLKPCVTIHIDPYIYNVTQLVLCDGKIVTISKGV